MKTLRLLALLVAVALGVGACLDGGPPSGPGIVSATLESPHGDEGAALLTLLSEGVVAVRGVGETAAFAEPGGQSTRVVLLHAEGGDAGLRVGGLRPSGAPRRPGGAGRRPRRRPTGRSHLVRGSLLEMIVGTAGRGRGPMLAWTLPIVALIAATVGPTASVRAQDVEAVAAARGIPLPAAYYRIVQEDPTAYSFARALFAEAMR